MNPEQTPQTTPTPPTEQPLAPDTTAWQPPAPNGMVTPTGGMVTPPTGSDGTPVLAPAPQAQPQVAAAPQAGVPPTGWNWGAFWLTWIWGIGNKVWWSLLALIPFVNIVMPFVLGAKGTAAAWEASDNKDIVAFKARQHTWAVVAWVWMGVSLLLIIPIMLMMVLTSYNGIQQRAQEAQNQAGYTQQYQAR